MNFFKTAVGTIIPVLLIIAGHMMLAPASCLAARKTVLIIHAYHQTNEWTGSIMEGMLEVFSDSGMDVDIHVEYLDTVRHPPETHFDLLEDHYRKKYSSHHFDVILLSDNPSLEFLLSRRERLFPGVPVVFCGVNNFQTDLLRGQTGITGINENIDIPGTIELALQINPDIQEFLFISDRSSTGLVNRAPYEQDMDGFRAEAPRFEFFDEFTVDGLKARLSELPNDAAILIIRLPTGNADEPMIPRDYLEIIAGSCNVPVYSLWSADIGKKVLGGVMVDGAPQGSMAARYALRIMQGEPVSSLPVVMKSPNVAMIDHRQLDRLGIPESVIPENVQIRFRPETLFDKYRYEILGTVLFITMLLVIIIILHVNIIIRKKTEKAFIASEEKLSTALEMAHLGHWEYDPADNRFTFNDQFFAIFHTTAEEAGGYTMLPNEYARRFVHPGDMHLVEKELRKAFETPDPRYSRRIEHRMRYADGATGYMAVRLFIAKDDRGQTIRIYGVAQDITELRQAEESILRGEERWRLILQTALDGFVLSDIQTRIVEVNDAYCSMTGYSKEELLGKHLRDLEAVETPEEAERHIQKIIEEGHDRFETRHRCKDGSLIDLEASVQYRSMEGGLLAAFLRDVTERKQIEARLQHGQKMEAVGTLAGGIAHDFNNILQPLLGFCELLKNDLPPDASEQGFVDGILDAALRAKELVDQILSFSRQMDAEARPSRLQPVIKEAMKLLRSSIPRTIDIRKNIDPDCGIVFADPIQIYQIIMNLCTNAYHAMEEGGGTLNLSLKQIHLEKENPVFPEMPPGDYALLKVSDTGVGIPRTILEKVFDPYFTTKEKAKGTGLGLSIVQGIVKRHNGDIRIYSEPEKGTEIHVYLPIVAPGKSDRGKVASKSIPGGNERILLVDDEKPVADMIQQMLKRLGYRVTTRTSAPEALETFRSGPGDFDLLITDLTMPRMTGIQLAGEVKGIREDIPIILCTGFSEQSDDGGLKAAGIRARLAKPVITKALAETVRNVLTTVKTVPEAGSHSRLSPDSPEE